MRIRARFLWAVAGVVVAVSLNPQSRIQSAIRIPQPAIPASNWRVLFDGTSLNAWRGYKTDTVPAGWKIENGTLAKNDHVGDLITRDEFGDFELELDWKIGRAGNSGIFYRGIEDADFKGAPNDDRIYTTGPEYQLLDDNEAADNKTRLTCAGANYGLYPSPPGHLKPVGDWNRARILARGAHVEHWLNGVKVVEYELWSPDWEAKVAATKFNAWPKFGRAKRGHIGLQGDHAGALGFRNIRIRELT
jgi:3-keto-disaccharide hydrolase